MSDLLILTDVKKVLEFDKASEPLIKLLIKVVSDGAEKYCNRKLIKATYAEKHDGDNTDDILVKNPPIVSVASITEDDITVSSDWYVFYEEEGCIKRKDSGAWAKGIQNIVVNYDGGYLQTALPNDLKWACLQWLLFLWKQKDNERIGVSSWGFGDQTTTFIIDEMPPSVKNILSRYRQVAFG